jgi:predicted nucleotidyltransferase
MVTGCQHVYLPSHAPSTPVSVRPVSDELLRRAAAQLAGEHDLELVVLFGSAARGERRVEDLDIAVLSRQPADTIALTNRLIELLHVQQVDLVDLRRADALLLALVARDGIPLYEADPSAFARHASLAARRFADTKKFREVEHQMLLDFIGRMRAPTEP